MEWIIREFEKISREKLILLVFWPTTMGPKPLVGVLRDPLFDGFVNAFENGIDFFARILLLEIKDERGLYGYSKPCTFEPFNMDRDKGAVHL